MKPMIIYEQISDDKLILTKEHFEEIVEQIYQAGYDDATKTLNHSPYPYFPSPTWVIDDTGNLHNKITTITSSHPNKRFNL